MSVLQTSQQDSRTEPQSRPPRLGFLGVGWIGLQRMQRLRQAGLAELVAVADPNPDAAAAAREAAPEIEIAGSLEELLDQNLEGVVIATPSALHASQSIAALKRGCAVFCQKPLARTAEETEQIVTTARKNDVLLGVDFSYRYLAGMDQVRQLLREQALGKLFAAELTFHNAYGPDKSWFYDPQLSGGGCVIDLGIHLIDLCDWLLGTAEVSGVRSHLWKAGELLPDSPDVVEDCALAEWQRSDGAVVRLACSWHLSAGCDAVIEATFYGTRGAVALKNVNGSFYDFQIEHREGNRRTILAAPPDDWGGRALIRWAAQLQSGNRFDDEMESVIAVARLLDEVYRR